MGPNEAPLEIGVDHPRCLGGRHAGLDGPGTGFLLAGGEVGAKPQQGIGGTNQTLQPPFAHPQTSQEFSAILFWQFNQFSLHLRRNRHGFGALLERQSFHLLHVGIARGQVVFAHVGGVDDRLGGEQPQGLHHGGLLIAERHTAGRPSGFQHHLNPLQGGVFGLGFLAGTGLFLEALTALFDLAEIGKPQFQIDHLRIPGRSHRSGHMDHIVVVKTTDHMDDRVHFPDVGQKFVAKPLPLAGPLNQPGNIHEFHPGGDQFFGA